MGKAEFCPVCGSLYNGIWVGGSLYNGTWVDDVSNYECGLLLNPDGSVYYNKSVRHHYWTVCLLEHAKMELQWLITALNSKEDFTHDDWLRVNAIKQRWGLHG